MPECILQPQSLLQRQQAMLKASLTGAWLTPNEVLIIGHTIAVPPKARGVPAGKAGNRLPFFFFFFFWEGKIFITQVQ